MDICPVTWGQEGWGAEDGLNYTHFSQGQMRADVALVPRKGRPSSCAHTLRICTACSAEDFGCDVKSQILNTLSLLQVYSIGKTSCACLPWDSLPLKSEKDRLHCSWLLSMWVWAWHMCLPRLRHHRSCCPPGVWDIEPEGISKVIHWRLTFCPLSSTNSQVSSFVTPPVTGNSLTWQPDCIFGGFGGFFYVLWRSLSCNEQKFIFL